VDKCSTRKHAIRVSGSQLKVPNTIFHHEEHEEHEGHEEIITCVIIEVSCPSCSSW
jgi:hypothetical protein